MSIGMKEAAGRRLQMRILRYTKYDPISNKYY